MLKNIIALMLLSVTTLLSAESDVLKEKCQNNDATACYEFALPLTTGENAKSQDIMEEGTSYMRKACIFGEDKACDEMGYIYFNDKSYGASIPYLVKSCDRSVKKSCELMGVIYRDGHDVVQDDVKSREFFEKACALNSASACYYVAIIYRGGFGVTKDRNQEKIFYQKSCDAGLKGGCERFTELDNADKGIETGIWATIKGWF